MNDENMTEVLPDGEVSSAVGGEGDNVSNPPDVVLDNPEAVVTDVSAPDQEPQADVPAAETGEEVLDLEPIRDQEEYEEEYYEVLAVDDSDPHLFFDTPFTDYTVTEGLLLLIFCLLFLKTLLSFARG